MSLTCLPNSRIIVQYLPVPHVVDSTASQKFHEVPCRSPLYYGRFLRNPRFFYNDSMEWLVDLNLSSCDSRWRSCIILNRLNGILGFCKAKTCFWRMVPQLRARNASRIVTKKIDRRIPGKNNVVGTCNSRWSECKSCPRNLHPCTPEFVWWSVLPKRLVTGWYMEGCHGRTWVDRTKLDSYETEVKN